jgi:DNA-binding response OmpR family regulator
MDGVGILLVSAEGGVVRSWNGALSDTGADVRIVNDGAAALQHLDLLTPDVILIDLDLPGTLSGLDSCRAIRSHSDAIVVLVASEMETFDEILALAVGADHFFAAGESERLVIARLESLVRRARGLLRVPTGVAAGLATASSASPSTPLSTSTCTAGTDCSRSRSFGRLVGRSAVRGSVQSYPRMNAADRGGQLTTWTGPPIVRDGRDGSVERIVVDDLEIDVDAREVWVAGTPVTLTKIEFDLLVTLAEQPRRVFTREQLMERAWGDPFDGSHVLDTHLSRLRCKVKGAGGERVAHALRGVGYRLRG